mmetsp:Transcript_83368/g.226439  ORF Transcript_83368/g.226439 Transcript_83368/m.226439 type:complete len:250 (-) Transcript_83368:495-1244(-)
MPTGGSGASAGVASAANSKGEALAATRPRAEGGGRTMFAGEGQPAGGSTRDDSWLPRLPVVRAKGCSSSSKASVFGASRAGIGDLFSSCPANPSRSGAGGRDNSASDGGGGPFWEPVRRPRRLRFSLASLVNLNLCTSSSSEQARRSHQAACDIDWSVERWSQWAIAFNVANLFKARSVFCSLEGMESPRLASASKVSTSAPASVRHMSPLWSPSCWPQFLPGVPGESGWGASTSSKLLRKLLSSSKTY